MDLHTSGKWWRGGGRQQVGRVSCLLSVLWKKAHHKFFKSFFKCLLCIMRECWRSDISDINAKLKPLVEDRIHRVLFKVLPKCTVYLHLVVYNLIYVVFLSSKPSVIFLLNLILCSFQK